MISGIISTSASSSRLNNDLDLGDGIATSTETCTCPSSISPGARWRVEGVESVWPWGLEVSEVGRGFLQWAKEFRAGRMRMDVTVLAASVSMVLCVRAKDAGLGFICADMG